MTYPDNLVDPADLYANESESSFQRHVINVARELGYEVYSHNTLGAPCPKCGTYVNRGRVVTSKGFPDLEMVRMDPPRHIWAELKSRKGRQTPDQKHWQALLEANDDEYYLWRPADRDKAFEILARR